MTHKDVGERSKRPLELAGVMERPEATYLVHVAFDRDGKAIRVRVTAATEGADGALFSIGTLISYALRQGKTLDELVDHPYLGGVAKIAADCERCGCAIVQAAYECAGQVSP